MRCPWVRAVLVFALGAALGCKGKEAEDGGKSASKPEKRAAAKEPAKSPFDRVAPHAVEGAGAAGVDCAAACRHLAQCGVYPYESCLPECAGADPQEIALIIGMTCEELGGQGGGATGATGAPAESECDRVCRHVVECGTNTMEGCLQKCGGASPDVIATVSRATCEELRAADSTAQAGGAGGADDDHGGGTAADCAAVGGALAGLVCSGPPFPCRRLGCPDGWVCGVEGQCHHARFTNCKKCP